MCPAKEVPKKYERVDEWWMPMDEESFKMREMEKTMNQLSQKNGKQPVKVRWVSRWARVGGQGSVGKGRWVGG